MIEAATAPQSTLRLALGPCPACGEDEAEPVAVGQDFTCETSAESLLAVRCRGCGVVYLNPAPAPASRDQLYPAAYFATPELAGDRRRAARIAARAAIGECRGLPASARLLELAYGAMLHVEDLRRLAPLTWTFEVATGHALHAEAARRVGVTVHVGSAGVRTIAPDSYDCVLLLHALEHCTSPVQELRAVASLLRPGGRIVVVAHNVDSAVSRAFQGRHWAGYDFPRHVALFGPSSLLRVADKAGCVVERSRAIRFGRAWSRSAATLLADWSAPGWVRGGARPGGVLAAGLDAAAEATLGRGERAAWMAAVLRPRESPR